MDMFKGSSRFRIPFGRSVSLFTKGRVTMEVDTAFLDS